MGLGTAVCCLHMNDGSPFEKPGQTPASKRSEASAFRASNRRTAPILWTRNFKKYNMNEVHKMKVKAVDYGHLIIQLGKPGVSCKTYKCCDDGTRGLSVLLTQLLWKSIWNSHQAPALRRNEVLMLFVLTSESSTRSRNMRNFGESKTNDLWIMKVRAVDYGHLVVNFSYFHMWHRGMLDNCGITF